MQFAKDSFYLVLRDRLAVLNPARTTTIAGVSRAAILVAENEPVTATPPVANTFYLDWEAPRVIHNDIGRIALLAMDCVISFEAESGTQAAVDRGRLLAQLTSELLTICSPPQTPKGDFTQSPSVDLGTTVFWTVLRFEDVQPKAARVSVASPARLRRTARLTVFFFPELEQS